ncbi:transposase [Prevotella copri]|uniref:IS66 family insertion sequence element accessory protein TnpB n=1 Tax=Segatella copri TaxID=165179 RepID=UPI001C38E305|nr:transposase [Segatella copri]
MTGSSSTRRTIVFYSKDYRKVKILHYDINGWVLCSKWFTDGKFLKPLNFRKSKLYSKIQVRLNR